MLLLLENQADLLLENQGDRVITATRVFKGSFLRKGDIFGWKKKNSDFKLLTLEPLKLHHQSLKLKFLKYAAQVTTDLEPVSAQNLCPKINVTFVVVV